MDVALASVIGEAWGSLAERRFLLLTLIGFVCAFGFIRLSTRLMRSPRVPWWPGSVVSEGGVHVHHLFFGIVLMMVAGGLSFAAGETDGPWYAIYAVLFGIGLPDENAHAPNEKLDLGNFHNGVIASAHFYDELAKA